MSDIISLVEMPPGEKGRIAVIQGGHGLIRKLDAMGIRIGKEITKVSAQWMRGPVLLRQGNTELAIGFGMAKHILVEICPEGGNP